MLTDTPQRDIRDNLQGDTTIINPVTRAGVGGLNLIDGALTTALTDSTVARNVVVGNDGVLRRRPGTRYVANLATGLFVEPPAPFRLNLASVTTARGHDFILFRIGSFIGARHVRESTTGNTIFVHHTGFNVLKEGRTSEGTILVLRDPTIRCLLFTPDNPTLEIRLNEIRVAGPTSGSTITFPRNSIEQLIPGVYLTQTLIQQQFNVMVNGVRREVTSISTSGNNITLTLNHTFTATASVVDVQLFQSHWWAEAEMYYGDRFSDTVTRTNLTEDDIHVPIPSNLRDGIEQRGFTGFNGGLFAPYTIDSMYWNGSQYVFYQPVDDGLPSTQFEYALSDGSARYDDSPVIPSPLFATYGEYEAGVVRPVVLTRHRRLNMRGGEGIAGQNLEVFVDDLSLPFSPLTTNASQPSFRLWDSSDSAQVTTLGGNANFISLDGQWQTRPQVNPSSVVRLVAYNNSFAPLNMTRVPCYGLTNICDYGQGSFPSSAATYQNRLVIAGMPHDPLLVAFSALYDSRTPDEPYMYFQNDPLDLQPDSAPFQVRLDSTADDRIVSLQEFQGSLFVITYRGVFRIAAAGRAVITASNYFVSSVASIGAVNSNAIARPEGGIAFLSPRGVFAIINGVQSNEATEYRLVELSTKISPIFDPTLNKTGPNRLWWMSYATQERRLYVGISTENDSYHASELYTYDSVNQSWSTMDTVGGFRTYGGIDIALERDKDQHYLLVDPFTRYQFTLISTGQRLHLDYQRSGLASDEPTLPDERETEAPRYPITSINSSVEYPGGRVFKVLSPMSPLTQVRDIEVMQGASVLDPVDDYVKLPGNYIQLTNVPAFGSGNLVIKHVTPLPGGVEPVEHNLGLAVEGLPYNEHDFTQGTTQTAKDAYNVWYWVREEQDYDWTIGVMFQSVWASPVYTLGQITQDKRLSAVTLYTERVRSRNHWFGTNIVYGTPTQWPELDVKDFAGIVAESTDAATDRQNAHIGLIVNQEHTLTHPLLLGEERDFFDLDEGTTEDDTTRPAPLQIADGVVTRRTFGDTVSVFQLVVVSIGQQPFGISAIQVDAAINPGKTVHKSR